MLAKRSILILGLLFVHAALAADRLSISLDGKWNSIIDPYETGLSSRYFDNRKALNKSDLVEYNFDASARLAVPGDWNTQRESLFFYEGPIWYQRYFNFSKPAHSRVFVRFGAANYKARVWLNGRKLGEHVGGFTPFEFEIKDELTDGTNSLVVEVNNTRHAEDIPALSTDWWNYGGLTRSVELVAVPENYIENFFLQLAKTDAKRLSGWVQVNGSQPAQTVKLEIPELGWQQSVVTDAKGRAEFSSPAKPQRWSPDNPKLYRVIVSAGDDHIEDRIGFRSIEARGAQILLNGKPIFLRGISVHEEAPYRGGRAFSIEDARTLLQWAKDLGCNFVRLAHYPHNQNMLRLADEMGVMVWSEIPAYWGIAWTEAGTLANARNQLREMIDRDHNRAAIVLWSVSNETGPEEIGRTEFLKALIETARQLDGTRLLTSAMNRTDRSGDTLRVLNDPLGEYLDVLGLNEYIGWYDKRPEEADATRWQFKYAKPVIVSEFGAGALYGLHGDAETRFTEEYQSNVFEHQLSMLRNIPGLAGMSPWLLMDFLSPRRQLVGIQDYHNRKGLVSDRGQRKQAFYVLQHFYQQLQACPQPLVDTAQSINARACKAASSR